MRANRLRALAAVSAIGTLLLAVPACSDDGPTATGSGAQTTTSTTATVASGCRSDAPSDLPAIAPGATRIEVESGGTTRVAERVVPPAHDGTTPLPLILDLHGYTSSIEQQSLFSGLPEAAAERGYVLITPQATDVTSTVNGREITAPYWNIRLDDADEATGTQDDVAFLTELIDATTAQLCIDAARVYVTGNSNGAGMATVLACELPGRIAAIGPVSGVNLAPSCPDAEPTSVIAFHGDADPLVPYDGGTSSRVPVDNPSVQERLTELAAAAGCEEAGEAAAVHDDVTVTRWDGCDDGLDVELYTVLGGGHTWPGMLNYVDVARLTELAQGMALPEVVGVDVAEIAGHMTTNLEATSVMLDFFDRHRQGG